MTRINTLLRKVESQFKPKLKLSLIIIDYFNDKNKYELQCQLWDGIYGSGHETIMSYHNNIEEAEKEISQVEQEYKWIYGNRVVIFDDVTE